MRTPACAVAFSLGTWWYHRLGLEVYALSFNITKKKKKVLLMIIFFAIYPGIICFFFSNIYNVLS